MKAADILRIAVVAGLIGVLAADTGVAQESRSITARGVVVEMRGVGPASVAEADRVIEDQLTMAGDSAASAPLADDLAYFLQTRYFQRGHAEARVDWELVERRIVLTVAEGPQLTVGAVTFTGVEGIAPAELKAFLLRPTREREGRWARQVPFVEADVRAGVDLVLRHLRAGGHLQATADEPTMTRSAVGGAMDIEVALTPGPMSVFGEVRVVGQTSSLPAVDVAKATDHRGQPFNEVALESMRSSLMSALQERGYFQAEVTAMEGGSAAQSPGVEAVPVTLAVTAGRQFAVREVQVDEGFSRGAARVARSVFSASTAQTFAPPSVDLLHRRALDTGMFSRLEVEPVVVGEGLLDLRVSGEEAAPKTLGFYGGYESLLGPILGMEARHVNFLDSGRAVSLRLEGRGTGGEGSLLWADPAIFGSRWSLGTGVSWETFTFADYDRQTGAWRTTLSRRLTRRITAEAMASVTTNEMDTEVLSPEELGPGEYTTASGGLRLTFDYRDHPLLARDGWMVGLTAEAGGIDGDEQITFVQGDVTAGWYQPLSDRWRVSLGGRARVMLTQAEVSEVPIDMRLFNGGATSVRSFAEREMGPMSDDGDTPLGGLASAVASAELSYEMIRDFEIALFADVGTLGEDSATFFRYDDLRYAIGLGLRYRLPIGPLRIDYGVNPDRHEGESFGALHVTFGFAF
jgi:outer membrane protein assembly factor BamA